MSTLRYASAILVLVVTAPLHAQTISAAPAKLGGTLLGEVRNASGVTQTGATVLLYDRFDNLVRRSLSTEDGRFGFAALAPDTYTVRVSLSTFLPAIRRIAVAAGSENLLRVSLAAMLSSIEVAPTPRGAKLMSDEWKWVLRSSQSTRPVLRWLPTRPDPGTSRAERRTSFLDDMTGVVNVSSVDSGLQQNMGTAFVVETPLNSNDRVRLAGNLGYASSGLPTAALRTTYFRGHDAGPGAQVSLTVRQAYLPIANANSPTLRTASLSMSDALEIDGVRLEYGSSLDSVMLFGRMAYVSPFARATYALGNGATIRLAFRNGLAPTELAPRTQGDFASDVAALAQAPAISRRDNHAAVERTKTYELSYQIIDGTRTLTATAFRDQVSNAVYLMSGDISLAGAANLMPDLNTRGTVFNAGNFQRTGYSIALSERLTDYLEVSVEGGQASALTAAEARKGPLRSSIQTSTRPWVTARVDGSAPITGTKLGASYGWTDFRALMPAHYALTGRSLQQVGWNFSARQPLPAMLGVRMELQAEMRNLLAQGYLVLRSAEGSQATLTNTPRQLRGGVNFIF
jgi:hypothetical protein